MPTIQEVRAQYPQYSDMSDQQLADALHAKFYSDMPKAQFEVKIGLRKDEGALNAAGRATGQGVFFGLSDEMKAAQAAADFPEWAKRIPGAIPVEMAVGAVKTLFSDDAQKRYDKALAEERAALANNRELHPIASAAGEIGGAIATAPLLPGATIAAGAGRAANAANAAATGALYSALYGAGTGEGAEGRLKSAAGSALIGGAIGGALGAALPVPSGGQSAAQGDDVAQAAENLSVRLPRAAATDSMPVQWGAKTLSNVPLAGTPLRKAAATANDDLGRAAAAVADSYGGGAAMSADQAGETLRAGLQSWIKGTSAEKVRKAYDAVDDLVRPGVLTPLEATRDEVAAIMAQRQRAALPGTGKAVDTVLDAIKRPGLEYEGVKGLRTYLGELLKKSDLPADMSQAELKRIYGALSQDLAASVKNAGGERAAQAFDQANRLAATVAKQREQLARILGNGAKSDEGLLSSLISKAGSKSTADLKSLVLAKKSMEPADWNALASSLVNKIGRDAEGQFSPERFLTAYGNLSDAGKKVLFGGQADLAKALDDIKTVASRLVAANKQFGNPSGTGQTLMGGAIGAYAMTNPLGAAAQVVGGNIVARILAQPVTAQSMAKWSRAYELAVRYPAAGSIKALQAASTRLSADIAKHIGEKVSPGSFTRVLQPNIAGKAEKDEKAPRR